jgi:hypothetical protein
MKISVKKSLIMVIAMWLSLFYSAHVFCLDKKKPFQEAPKKVTAKELYKLKAQKEAAKRTRESARTEASTRVKSAPDVLSIRAGIASRGESTEKLEDVRDNVFREYVNPVLEKKNRAEEEYARTKKAYKEAAGTASVGTKIAEKFIEFKEKVKGVLGFQKTQAVVVPEVVKPVPVSGLAGRISMPSGEYFGPKIVSMQTVDELNTAASKYDPKRTTGFRDYGLNPLLEINKRIAAGVTGLEDARKDLSRKVIEAAFTRMENISQKTGRDLIDSMSAGVEALKLFDSEEGKKILASMMPNMILKGKIEEIRGALANTLDNREEELKREIGDAQDWRKDLYAEVLKRIVPKTSPAPKKVAVTPTKVQKPTVARVDLGVKPATEFFKDVMGIDEALFKRWFDTKDDKNIKEFFEKYVTVTKNPDGSKHFKLKNPETEQEFDAGTFREEPVGGLKKQAEERLAALRKDPSKRAEKTGSFKVLTLAQQGTDSRQVDVAALQANPDYRNAVFVVASNFNALETVDKDDSIEKQSLSFNYPRDKTQGPMATMSAGPALIVRQYLLNYDESNPPHTWRQTDAQQTELLKDMGIKTKSGYIVESVEDLAKKITSESMSKMRIAVHSDIQVNRGFLKNFGAGTNETFYDPNQKITQVLSAGLDVGQPGSPYRLASYGDLPNDPRYPSGYVEETNKKIYRALCAAIPGYEKMNETQKRQAEAKHDKLMEEKARIVLDENYQAYLDTTFKDGKNKLVLARIGGGAFGNKPEWIDGAIEKVLLDPANLEKIIYGGIDIELNNFRDPISPKMQKVIEQIEAARKAYQENPGKFAKEMSARVAKEEAKKEDLKVDPKKMEELQSKAEKFVSSLGSIREMAETLKDLKSQMDLIPVDSQPDRLKMARLNLSLRLGGAAAERALDQAFASKEPSSTKISHALEALKALEYASGKQGTLVNNDFDAAMRLYPKAQQGGYRDWVNAQKILLSNQQDALKKVILENLEKAKQEGADWAKSLISDAEMIRKQKVALETLQKEVEAGKLLVEKLEAEEVAKKNAEVEALAKKEVEALNKAETERKKTEEEAKKKVEEENTTESLERLQKETEKNLENKSSLSKDEKIHLESRLNRIKFGLNLIRNGISVQKIKDLVEQEMNKIEFTSSLLGNYKNVFNDQDIIKEGVSLSGPDKYPSLYKSNYFKERYWEKIIELQKTEAAKKEAEEVAKKAGEVEPNAEPKKIKELQSKEEPAPKSTSNINIYGKGPSVVAAQERLRRDEEGLVKTFLETNRKFPFTVKGFEEYAKSFDQKDGTLRRGAVPVLALIKGKIEEAEQGSAERKKLEKARDDLATKIIVGVASYKIDPKQTNMWPHQRVSAATEALKILNTEEGQALVKKDEAVARAREKLLETDTKKLFEEALDQAKSDKALEASVRRNIKDFNMLTTSLEFADMTNKSFTEGQKGSKKTIEIAAQARNEAFKKNQERLEAAKKKAEEEKKKAEEVAKKAGEVEPNAEPKKIKELQSKVNNYISSSGSIREMAETLKDLKKQIAFLMNKPAFAGQLNELKMARLNLSLRIGVALKKVSPLIVRS